jgi:signal transduction histidine kinase/CheY-like chemotaxis protein
MSGVTLWNWISFRQDYGWFLVGGGWASVLFIWMTAERRSGRHTWLPWAGAAGMATALLEISQMLVTTEQQGEDPQWLAWDVALGVSTALLSAGWWLAAGRSWRHPALKALKWVLVAAALILAAGRLRYPVFGGAALVVLVAAAAAVLFRSGLAAGRWDRTAVAVLSAGEIFSTHGPLAELLHLPHRYIAINPMGPAAAAFQLAGIAGCWAVLRQSSPFLLGNTTGEAERAELHRLLRALCIWLVIGSLLTEAMGYWARRNFERSILSRVTVSSKLIDGSLAAAVLGKRFVFSKVFSYRQDAGSERWAAKLEDFPPQYLQPLIKSVETITAANPDVGSVFIVTNHDGWVANFWPSTLMPSLVHYAGLYGRVKTQDVARWNSRSAEVIGPVQTYYGSVVQARAPLSGPNNEMLGWLAFDMPASRWVAAQVQVRLLAFAVVALGAGMLALNWTQGQRERQRAEAQRSAAAAQAANELKTEFLAKVSHELRTPLQSVLGYCELLREGVTTSKGISWLTALRHNSDLMVRLVNDLIDLSALEIGSFTLSAKVVNPGDLVGQTVESFRPRAEEKGVGLAFLADSRVPAWVEVDGERLRQIVINLVGNAVKFTDRGGVTVGLVSDESEFGELRLRLTVRDTGPGIAPSSQVRLFSAFSRLEATSEKEGSGLGLALSSALCRRMGGGIELESDGCTGSCFTATVLVTPAAPPPVSASKSESGWLRGRRILIVDDNPLIRELFVSYLAEKGAVCAVNSEGTSALTRLTASVFDAVVLDLSLPGVDGADIARQLRKPGVIRYPLRIIGVSAHANSADRTRAVAAGMDAFLVKPVSLEELAVSLAGVENPAEARPAFRPSESLRQRLLEQFQSELPAKMAEIRRAIDAENWARLRAHMHYLRNGAVAVADDALFDACLGIEVAAEANDGPAVMNNWPRCARALARWPNPASQKISLSFTPDAETSNTT